MITIGLEEASLDTCINAAQHERVVITCNGTPIALVVNIEGLDEEQLELGSSDTFWQLITERRAQKTMSRSQLEQTLNEMN